MSNIKASKMIWLKWSNLTKVVIRIYKKMMFSKESPPERLSTNKIKFLAKLFKSSWMELRK